MSDLIKINETIQTIKNSNKPELDLLVKNLDKALLWLSQEELIPIHNNILQSIKDWEFKNHFNKISIQWVFHSRLTDHSVIFKAEEKKRKIQEEEDKKAEAERKKLEEKETKDIEAERIIKAEEKKIKDEEEIEYNEEDYLMDW